MVLSILTILAASCGLAQAGRSRPSGAWRGWWFIVHRDAQGRWRPDKFAVAVVIDDGIGDPPSQRATGQWIGCVWSPANELSIRSEVVTLRFGPDDNRRFRMERTGPDEAQGYYLDDKRERLTMQRWSDHDTCAGYFP